jgi:NAD(P)H-nitrite reductase large subunit
MNKVKKFDEAGNQMQVILNSDTKLNTDLVVLAVGVIPDTSFIKDSGLKQVKEDIS